jgi:hypothetical protein
MAHGNKAENKKKAKDGTDRGRPPGSPNRDYAVGQATAPRCLKCHGTAFEDQRLVVAREINGTAPDGKPFNRIYNYNHRCKNPRCGQWNKLIIYELVPVQEPSEEAGQDQPPEAISGDGRDHDASNPAEIENEDEFDDALDLDSILAAEDVGT